MEERLSDAPQMRQNGEAEQVNTEPDMRSD